jgi:hypothetical protein
MSFWARASNDVYFLGGWRPKSHMLVINHSSLLLPTDLIKELGGWDAVRIGADNEFLWRLRKKFGRKSLSKTLPNVPLSISCIRDTSLTRAPETHVKTVYHGLRGDYRQMYLRWQERAAKSGNFCI